MMDAAALHAGAGQLGRIDGVMIGVVTNNNDPDKLGRVKLHLPLHDEQAETDWARIATMMAGKEMGSLFIPEVGDEVLVAFHLGQIQYPIVIGMLWNKKHSPPAPADKNDERKLISRSGNQIAFSDKSGEETITVKTKKGQTLVLADKDDSLTIADQGGSNTIVIKGGSANAITIKSGSTQIQLDSSGKVSIQSNQEIKLKSTQLQIEAAASMTLKAGASLDLKSDGIINIKGTMVKIN